MWQSGKGEIRIRTPEKGPVKAPAIRWMRDIIVPGIISHVLIQTGCAYVLNAGRPGISLSHEEG